MNFELHVLYDDEGVAPYDALRMSIDRHIRYGWDGIVLTRNVESARKVVAAPDPVPLSNRAKAIIERRYGLTVLGDYKPFPQYSRLNLVTNEVQEVNQLNRNIASLSYDIISVTPLNDDVFRTVCSTSDVDIITVDTSRYVPKKCWKELKAAVNRGIAIEFLYSRFLENDYQLKTIIAACQSTVHATKGRKAMTRVILLSNGSDSPDFVRSPADVRNLARMVGLPNDAKITSEFAKNVLAKGLARRTHAGVVRKMREPAREDEDEELQIVIKDAP